MPSCRFALLFFFMNYLLSISIDPLLVSIVEGAYLLMSHSSKLIKPCSWNIATDLGNLETSSMLTQVSGLIGGGYKSLCWKHKVRLKYDNQTPTKVESLFSVAGVSSVHYLSWKTRHVAKRKHIMYNINIVSKRWWWWWWDDIDLYTIMCVLLWILWRVKHYRNLLGSTDDQPMWHTWPPFPAWTDTQNKSIIIRCLTCRAICVHRTHQSLLLVSLLRRQCLIYICLSSAHCWSDKHTLISSEAVLCCSTSGLLLL